MSGHLVDGGVVESLQFSESSGIIGGNKVDGNSLSSESSRSSNSVNVVLQISGQIVVDDQRNLLDIDSSSKEISGDEDSGRSSSEFIQNDISFLLSNISVGGRNGEFSASHFVCQPIDLPSGIAENDGLGDVEGIVQVAKGIEFPVLPFDGNIKLFDSFQGQFVSFDQNSNWLVHESSSDFESFWWHSGAENSDLSLAGQNLEDIVHLVFESS